MPNIRLRAGERSIRHQVVIPESLDRQLRARAVIDGDRKISEVIRAAIESYVANEAPCKACAQRHRMGTLPARCPRHLDNADGQRQRKPRR